MVNMIDKNKNSLSDIKYTTKIAQAIRECTDIQKAFLEGYVKGLEMAEHKKAS